ncbi:MAG: ATP-dependent DNA helicase RecG [Clostridia bacterium]|nr:ATP-dependent DNA helicase RecG [Clostridia bacterium]
MSAAENALTLDSPIDTVSGIGKIKKALFERVGIRTVSELLCYAPSGWIDTAPAKFSEASGGAVRLFVATVLTRPARAYIKGGRRSVSFSVSDGEERATVCYLNQPYAASAFEKGETVLLMGRVCSYSGKLWLFSPQKLKKAPDAVKLAVYPKTAGLSDNDFRKAVASVLHLCGLLPDPLPESLLKKNSLPSLGEALRALHAPKDDASLAAAKRRLGYDALLRLALRVSAFEEKRSKDLFDPFENPDMKNFFGQFPFTFTDCQLRALSQIAGDLTGSGKRPVMNRLLQGDVGSGKTAVAAAACYICAANGFNSVVMAPTEILASQHYEFFKKIFSPLGIRTAFLSGSAGKAERDYFNSCFEDPDGVPVVGVGTHALLEPGAKINNAALAVIDEQQRFGVGQRGKLAEKCRIANTLVMTATPIPRSLALFLFSPDNVSELDSLPPGRLPVKTYLIGENKRERLTAFMDELVSKGGRVYVVCPLIDESEDPLGLNSAAETAKRIAEALPERRVALLHGKMKNAEKDAVMAQFASGKAQILVSTTVIEVGVNVPEANLMVIENADRFGLSQLHQLRGRVGRGKTQSFCVLVTARRNADALRRLKKLCETGDGFEIARFDLEERGPGDFFGTLQSGHGFGEGFGEELTQSVREDAVFVRESDPALAEKLSGARVSLN